jgi:hypothetical protein
VLCCAVLHMTCGKFVSDCASCLQVGAGSVCCVVLHAVLCRAAEPVAISTGTATPTRMVCVMCCPELGAAVLCCADVQWQRAPGCACAACCRAVVLQ